jgi:hypothetical protein
MHPAIEVDHARQLFICRLGGPGDPIVETETLADMEAFLDAFDLRVAAADPAAKLVRIVFRRKTHVGTDATR